MSLQPWPRLTRTHQNRRWLRRRSLLRLNYGAMARTLLENGQSPGAGVPGFRPSLVGAVTLIALGSSSDTGRLGAAASADRGFQQPASLSRCQ
jgi:hypothetical protein